MALNCYVFGPWGGNLIKWIENRVKRPYLVILLWSLSFQQISPGVGSGKKLLLFYKFKFTEEAVHILCQPILGELWIHSIPMTYPVNLKQDPKYLCWSWAFLLELFFTNLFINLSEQLGPEWKIYSYSEQAESINKDCCNSQTSPGGHSQNQLSANDFLFLHLYLLSFVLYLYFLYFNGVKLECFSNSAGLYQRLWKYTRVWYIHYNFSLVKGENIFLLLSWQEATVVTTGVLRRRIFCTTGHRSPHLTAWKMSQQRWVQSFFWRKLPCDRLLLCGVTTMS